VLDQRERCPEHVRVFAQEQWTRDRNGGVSQGLRHPVLTRYVVSRRGTTTPGGHPQYPPGRTVAEPAGQVRAAAGEKGRLEFASQLDAGCPDDPGDAAQLGVG